MADTEKILQAMEEYACRDTVMRDALELLKKQQAKPVLYMKVEYTGGNEAYCPDCGCFIEKYNPRRPWREVKYCCYCGQEVTWK